MRSRCQSEIAGVSRRSVLAAAVTTTALVHTGVGMAGDGDSGGQKESKGKVPVAFLLDVGTTVIDFAGPWETFQDVDAGAGRGFQLYTVAASADRYRRKVVRVTPARQALPSLRATPFLPRRRPRCWSSGLREKGALRGSLHGFAG